jgi:hypothetical protein
LDDSTILPTENFVQKSRNQDQNQYPESYQNLKTKKKTFFIASFLAGARGSPRGPPFFFFPIRELPRGRASPRGQPFLFF